MRRAGHGTRSTLSLTSATAVLCACAALFAAQTEPAFGADAVSIRSAAPGPKAIRLVVDVPGKGHLAATGVRGSTQALTPRGRLVSGASTVTLTVRLTAATQRRLASDSVVVCVAVRFTAADGTTQTTARNVVLKRVPPPTPVTG